MLQKHERAGGIIGGFHLRNESSHRNGFSRVFFHLSLNLNSLKYGLSGAAMALSSQVQFHIEESKHP
jgi:hypothetical protein